MQRNIHEQTRENKKYAFIEFKSKVKTFRYKTKPKSMKNTE